MKRIVEMVITSFLSGGLGFYYASSTPPILHIQREVQQQEVRDSYFRKCEIAESRMLKGNGYQQTWSCPKTKVFVVKKWTTVQLEGSGE
jgi:hypothetical protein